MAGGRSAAAREVGTWRRGWLERLHRPERLIRTKRDVRERLRAFRRCPTACCKNCSDKQLGAGAVRVVAVDEASGAERDKALAETEAALGGYGSFDKTLLEKMPRLKFYQQPSVGFDNVDLAACSARGVLVANLAGVNAVAVAEHTILLALASLEQLIPANAATHAGKWTQRERMSKRDSFELEGKTWGSHRLRNHWARGRQTSGALGRQPAVF